MGINKRERNNFNPKNTPKIFILLTIFLVLFFFPLISAVEVSMNSNFSQGETLLAKFSGNFIDQITRDNVVFYRSHVKIPIVYNVVKMNEEFYVYALLTGKTPGNYSLNIERVSYMKGAEIVDNDIISNFSISNETAIFSVSPGALSTGTDFSVEIQNLQDKKITVKVNKDSSSIDSPTSLELKSGEKKNLLFNVTENAVKEIVNIDFSSGDSSYTLPVYLDINKTSGTKDFEMKFQPSIGNISMATSSSSKRILYLTNTGGETIEDILLESSPLLENFITISPEKISKLNPGDTEKIEIQASSDSNEKIIEGKITASTENLSTSFTLVLDFIKDFVPTEPVILTECADLGGTICAQNFECSDDIVQTKNGDCCRAPATCQEIKKSSSKKFIGWGLLVLVLIFLYWFYKKRYKRVAKRKAF